MLKIIIWADSNDTIGRGHYSRCLNLAFSLIKKGASVTFLSSFISDVDREQLIQKDINLLHLSPITGSIAPTLDKLVSDNGKWSWLIIDSYHSGAISDSILSKYAAHTLVIDDLADRARFCDLLLNQNWISGVDCEPRFEKKLYQALVPKSAKVLFGSKYALLSAPSKKPPRWKKLQSQINILVCFGGGNAWNNFVKSSVEVCLDALFEACDLKIIVVGPLELQNSWASSKVSVYPPQKSLSPFYEWADIAIGGCGVSALERLAFNLPSIGICLASNQRVLANNLSKAGLILLVDAYSQDLKSEMKRNLEKLISDFAFSYDRIRRGRYSTYDGKGPDRVSRAIFQSVNTKTIYLDKAAVFDSDFCYELRNKQSVRRYSRSKRWISRDEHYLWYIRALEFDTIKVLIARNSYRKALGYVRFERVGECFEISVALDDWARGCGLSTSIIKKGIEVLWETCGSLKIKALVHFENSSSLAAFGSAGFVEERSDSTSTFLSLIYETR